MRNIQMNNDRFIEGKNLSDAWAKAFLLAYSSPDPLFNLTVGFPICGQADTLLDASQDEIGDVHNQLDSTLMLYKKRPIHTVANTIFPFFWNPELPNDELYTRYMDMWMRVKKHNGNKNGTYFQR